MSHDETENGEKKSKALCIQLNTSYREVENNMQQVIIMQWQCVSTLLL